MDRSEANTLVQKLTAGFEALQGEYQKLFEQHHALERKLATARDQYNEVVRQYGSGATSTPPLSLASSHSKVHVEADLPRTASESLLKSQDPDSQLAGVQVKEASEAANTLQHGLRPLNETPAHGVKIWSGRSADKPETCSMMPSISESPLEQDFTIEGVPSKLGCPFASMANKKLSSHAASVLSRYNAGSAVGASTPSIGSANRINGRQSFEARRGAGDGRSSFADPIKAEICGLSDHEDKSAQSEQAAVDNATQQDPNAEPGVCPIRFLDQHSPEEVATYFERHKHELPRSHEVCVRRYQSNEKQIQELDAKYGNLVSMISGLGAKHKGMLPEEPDDADVEAEPAADAEDVAKIRKWASSVSAMGKDAEIADEPREDEERQPHFERPLRDVRVGESPSRPWGVPIPARYLEAAGSEASSQAVEPTAAPPHVSPTQNSPAKAGKCPFGHGGPAKKQAAPPITNNEPIFVAAESDIRKETTKDARHGADVQPPRMVFSGPVFIGYSAEEAAKILQLSSKSAG